LANFNFPKNVTQFNTYLVAFHKSFNTNYRQYGFTQSDVKVFNQFYKSWQQNYAMYTQFSQMQEFFNKFWSNEFANFQAYFSYIFNQIQKSTNYNGNGHYWFGNSAPRTIPGVKTTVSRSSSTKKTTAKKSTVKRSTSTVSRTPVRSTSTARTSTPARKSVTVKKSTSSIKSMANSSVLRNAPIVWFTSNKKGQVNVWVGNSKNGGFKLPEGAIAAYVEYRYEGGAWTRLTQGAKFPFIHSLNSNKKVYYRACWVGPNNTKGVFSTTVSWNNSAKAAA
jgi:hypothetical protein